MTTATAAPTTLPDPNRRYWTVREVAYTLNSSEWTVRRRIKTGTLPAVRLGGEWRVPVAELELTLSEAEGQAALDRQQRQASKSA